MIKGNNYSTEENINIKKEEIKPFLENIKKIKIKILEIY